MYQPKYTISNKILRNIGAIEGAKEVIENAPIVPYYEKQFKTEAIARQVHHGTHIEGNDLTLSQTKQILEGEDVMAKGRDIQEVINYRKVVNLLEELQVKRGGYDAQMLLDIHKETVNKIIDDANTGQFRTTAVIIKEEGTDKIIFQPPPHVEVPFLIEEFINWLNSESVKEIHPVLLAGIVHYVLVTIHPFVEGNGRSVRAFATLVMLRQGYDIKRFFALEEHFDNDLSSYYRAFLIVDRQSPNIQARDLTPWLEYFSEVVAAEMTKIKDRVRTVSIDSRLKGKIGKQVALSERQMKLIEYISDTGGAVMYDLKAVLPMVSEDTVLRDVKDLMDKGIIRKEGKTKASRYYMSTN